MFLDARATCPSVRPLHLHAPIHMPEIMRTLSCAGLQPQGDLSPFASRVSHLADSGGSREEAHAGNRKGERESEREINKPSPLNGAINVRQRGRFYDYERRPPRFSLSLSLSVTVVRGLRSSVVMVDR